MRPQFLLVFTVLMVLGCASEPPWNVLVVTFDTTRADHIGCYGNDQASTPVLDRLAAEGILFEQAIVPVPITLPSHSSLMTGKVPVAHGVHDNGLFVLGEEHETLAEILGDAGYRTAGAIGSFPLTAQFGINQGFEFFDDKVAAKYEDVYGDRVFPKEQLFFDERPAARVNDAVLPWLEENHQEPFFLWVHYFDPHHPHNPPVPFDQLFVHDLYSGEIAYADESMGVLLGHLKRLGVLERTLVVFTSDHGEGNGEHREATHSMLAYNSTLHVPLIIRVPGGAAGVRVAERVSTVDVMPTVLDLLGLEGSQEIQGRSLRALFEPAADPSVEDLPIYAETLSPRLTRGWGELRAIFLGDYKYIHGPRPELYDLAKDPREIHDLVEERPEVAAQLKQLLERYLVDNAVIGLDSSAVVDDHTAERLAALGYLQNAGEAVGPIEEVLRDDGSPPQDHAGTVSALSQAKQLLFQDRPLEARDFIYHLIDTDPENAEYQELLANAELRLGRVDEAVNILERLVGSGSIQSRPEKTLRTLASILLGRGDYEGAYEKYRDAEAFEKTAIGHYRLAKIHELRGEDQDQLRFLREALEIEPGFVPARINLGIWYAQHGDLDEAEFHLVQAMADNPYNERVFFNLGVFLAQSHRPEEAMSHFERAVELKWDYLQARSALIELQFDMGDREGALKNYGELVDLAPNSPEARSAQILLEIDS